jgi:spore coat protein A
VGRYVWHCHLLEHAANEMMRPFEVVAKGQGWRRDG